MNCGKASARAHRAEPSQVLAAAERYFGAGLDHCSVAVIGSEENLRAANARLEEPLELHKI